MVQKTDYIWKNGMIPWDEAVVHELTHALHYGSSAYEGIRCYMTENGPAIFRLHDHIERLYESARVLGIEIPYSKEEMVEAAIELVRKNGLEECYIRHIVYRGVGPMGLFSLNNPVEVSISAWEWPAYIGESATTMISSYRRIPKECVPSHAKLGGLYVALQLAKHEAKLAGYDEAVLLDTRGFVSEGAGENIFLIGKDGLITPSKESSILPGITRATLMEIAEKEFSLPTLEKDVTLDELCRAESAALTGTAAEVTPITRVNRFLFENVPNLRADVVLGNDEINAETLALKEKYFRLIRGLEPKYDHWLTYVNSNVRTAA